MADAEVTAVVAVAAGVVVVEAVAADAVGGVADEAAAAVDTA